MSQPVYSEETARRNIHINIMLLKKLEWLKSLVALWGEVYCLRGKLFSVKKLEGPTMNYLLIFFSSSSFFFFNNRRHLENRERGVEDPKGNRLGLGLGLADGGERHLVLALRCLAAAAAAAAKLLQSCLTLCRLQPDRLLCPWDFPDQNTGVGCHALLHGIIPTMGWNPGLLHCRQILYCEATMASLVSWWCC